jgi:hypothetical protein
MTDSLMKLLDTEKHPYGFRFDWTYRLSDTLASTGKSVSKIKISSTDVHNAMECPGLWAASNESNAVTRRIKHGGRQAVMTRQVARRWMQANLQSPIRPFTYVEAQLNDVSWMTTEQAQWISRQQAEERMETVGEIATVLSRIERDIKFEKLKPSAHVGMRENNIEFGNLTLTSDDVDLCVGTHKIEEEGAWAKTVLLAFVSDNPNGSDLEKLGFSVALHAMNTGCPPARVVAYGLFDGVRIYIDVDAEWVETEIGKIMATTKTINQIRNGNEPSYTPGDYCERCPLNMSCEFSGYGRSRF